MPAQKPKTVDGYIRSFPKDVQSILQKVRKTIKSAAPKAEEVISYQIPTFKLNGQYLIYFAGFKHHIGLYPASSEMIKKIPKLALYRVSKGTLKFMLDEPMPYHLIKKVIQFKVKENKEAIR